MIKFLCGFVYDALDDTAGVLEVILEFMPDEWRFTEKYLDRGIDGIIWLRDKFDD